MSVQNEFQEYRESLLENVQVQIQQMNETQQSLYQKNRLMLEQIKNRQRGSENTYAVFKNKLTETLMVLSNMKELDGIGPVFPQLVNGELPNVTLEDCMSFVNNQLIENHNFKEMKAGNNIFVEVPGGKSE